MSCGSTIDHCDPAIVKTQVEEAAKVETMFSTSVAKYRPHRHRLQCGGLQAFSRGDATRLSTALVNTVRLEATWKTAV